MARTLPRTLKYTGAPRAVRRLPLASLRVFVAAGEHESFSRAADALGVTVAAVSLQIRALEQYLRVPLFVRRGNIVRLTEEGARFLPQLRAALLELEHTVEAMRRERSSGALTVSTLASFLQQWLLPRLPDFNRRHPRIDLRLHTSPEPVDFLKSDVQVALRFGAGSWPPLHAEKLLDDWMVAVCTPAHLDKHGPVRTRRDLERHRLLHSVSEPWSAWIEGRLEAEEWVPQGASFDDSVAVVRAAVGGHGLALTRWSLAAGEIASGNLVQASRRVVPLGYAYWFVCPPAYLKVEKVARLREWLQVQAAATPRPPA